MALLQQGVQERMIHLNKKYELLSTEYEELCRMVIDIISQMGGTYAPSFWPNGLENYQPSSPPLPAPPLF